MQINVAGRNVGYQAACWFFAPFVTSPRRWRGASLRASLPAAIASSQRAAASRPLPIVFTKLSRSNAIRPDTGGARRRGRHFSRQHGRSDGMGIRDFFAAYQRECRSEVAGYLRRLLKVLEDLEPRCLKSNSLCYKADIARSASAPLSSRGLPCRRW